MNGTFTGHKVVLPAVTPAAPRPLMEGSRRDEQPCDPPGTKYTLSYRNADGVDKVGEIDAKCVVTINGQLACLEDLRPGDKIELSGQPATTVIATRDAATEAAEEIRLKTAEVERDRTQRAKAASNKDKEAPPYKTSAPRHSTFGS